MNMSRSVCRIVLINFFFCQACLGKSIFEPIWSYFSKPSYERTSLQEMKIPHNGTLTIKNTAGSISIKEWNQETVQLKVTKQAFKEELINKTVVEAQHQETALVLTTHHKTADHSTLVHYELIVPHNTKLNVATGEGNISIEKLNAPIKANARIGSISINGTKATVDALVDTGNITINNVSGNVRAETHTGDIFIYGAQHTVVAKTKAGKITTECATVPSLDTIILNTQSGDINLALPHKTNADLQAHTGKGTLTCDHFVTIKPHTTQLNKKAWSRLKKEVSGTLGTGEATIKISAGTGHIKISELTA